MNRDSILGFSHWNIVESRKMNLVQQNEEVVKEIEEYYSFLWKIVLRNMLRSFIPTKTAKIFRIQFQFFQRNFRKKQPLNILQMRQEQLDLLCSSTEKSNPYYQIFYSDPHHIHALSEHLIRIFPTFNWIALESVTHVRVDLIPRVKLMNILHIGMFVLAVFGAFKIFETYPTSIDPSNPWIAVASIGLAYIAIFSVMILFVFGRARRRLQRTTNILRYMAIRSRVGAQSRHGMDADDLPPSA